MAEPLKLMGVFAHPDDECLGTGGTYARYAAEGVATYLVTATRGERGWTGPADENPGLTGLGQIRTGELQAAAAILGIREVSFLNYIDGDLDQAPPLEAIAQIVGHVRRVRPQVVMTFGPDGAYGHPDHIAISQFTTAAVVAATDATFTHPLAGDAPPYRVAKLYYKVWTQDEFAVYHSVFGDQVMPVDGVGRRPVPWQDWAVTTRLDTSAYWRTIWQAVTCHRSQLPGYGALVNLTEADHLRLWSNQGFYRAYSLVNGGRVLETDLFAGLRG